VVRGRFEVKEALLQGMRRLMAITGLTALGLTPLVATAAPAGAQGDPEYPPGSCQLALSVSVAERGQTVLASTVNCTSGCNPGATVTLELLSAPIFLTSARSNGDGLFTNVPFVVPQEATLGPHIVRSTCPGAEIDTLVLTAPLTVVARGGGQPPAREGGGGGALAFTGSDSVLLVWFALILLTIGTALVLAARRRAEARRRVSR
jgi:hypothetical protein